MMFFCWTVQAPVLVDFWQENFKVQVEARSGALYIHPRGKPRASTSKKKPLTGRLWFIEEPPKKRRKTIREAVETHEGEVLGDAMNIYPNFDMDIDVDIGVGIGLGGAYLLSFLKGKPFVFTRFVWCSRFWSTR